MDVAEHDNFERGIERVGQRHVLDRHRDIEKRIHVRAPVEVHVVEQVVAVDKVDGRPGFNREHMRDERQIHLVELDTW